MATKSTITIEGEEVEIYLGNDGKPLTIKLDGKEVYAKEDGKTPLLDDFDAPINVAAEEANNEEKIDIANLFVDRLKNPTSNKPAADSQSEKPAVGKLNIAALQGGAVSALMGQRTANLDEPKGNSAAPDIAQGQTVKADPAKPSQNPSASAPPPPPPPPLPAAPLAPRTPTPKPSNVTAPAAPAPQDNSLEIGLLKQRLSREYGVKMDPQEGEEGEYTPEELAKINEIRQKIAALSGKASSAPEANDFTAKSKQDTAAAASVLSNMLNNRLVQPPPAMVQQNVSDPTSSASVTAETDNASPTAPGAIPTPPPPPNWGKPPAAPATTTPSDTATDENPKAAAEDENPEVEEEVVIDETVDEDAVIAAAVDTTANPAVDTTANPAVDTTANPAVDTTANPAADTTANPEADTNPIWNGGIAPPTDLPPSPPPTTTPVAYIPSDQAIALGLGGEGVTDAAIQKKLRHAARVFDEMRSTENIYQERIALVNEELKQKMLNAYDTGRVTDDEKAVCSKEALSKLLDSIMAINEISKKMSAALDIPDIPQFEALVKESVDLYANYTIAFKIPPNSISRDDFDEHFKGANDANSLLSAPMQRFLKYPLLCRELISDLQPTHPTFAKIKSLSDVAIDGATKINEAKRSAENISSENASKTQLLTDKLAKLSTGSKIDKPENLLLRDIAKQFSDQNNNGEKINLAKALANIYMERSGQSRSDYMKIISKGLQVPGFTKAEIKAAVKASTDPTRFASFIPSASEELESAVKKSSERQSLPPSVASAPSDENTDPNAQKSARNQAEDKPKKGSFFQKLFTGNRRKSAPGAVETTLPAEHKAPARPANEAPPTPLAASVPPPSADVQDNLVKPTRAAPVPAANTAPPPPPPPAASAPTADVQDNLVKPTRAAPVPAANTAPPPPPPPAASAPPRPATAAPTTPPPVASAPSADVQDNLVKPTRAAPVPAANTAPPPPPPPAASAPTADVQDNLVKPTRAAPVPAANTAPPPPPPPAASSPATPPPVASAPQQPATANPNLSVAQQAALKAQEKSLASNQQKQQAAAKKADEANTKSFGELYKEDLKNVFAQTKSTFENMGVPKDEYEAFAQLFEILMNLFALATSPANQLINAGFQKAWAAAKEKYHDTQAEKQGEKFKDPKEQEERLARLDKLIGKSDEKIESLKAEIDKAGPDSRKGQKLSRELEFEQAKQGLLTEARDNTAKHLATLTQDKAVHLDTAPTNSATTDADNDDELFDILTAGIPDTPENAVENSPSAPVTTAPVVPPPPPQPLREVALTRLDASVENQFFNAILNQDHEHLSMLAREHDSNLVYPDITLINIAKAFGNQEAVKILKDNGADAAYAERVDLTKQFGHVLNLSGKVDDQIRLKDGSVAKTQNNAEFGRAFHAMAFFEQHFQHFNNKNNINTPFSNQVNEAVKFAKEHYNKADKHDFAAFYDRIANQPNKPTYLPSGHSSPGGDNHNVGIICYNGYLIVCDGGNQNNIAIYNVGDFKKDDIQKLLNSADKAGYEIVLKKITQGKAVETIPSNGQQFNNCTYINLAGAVQGLNYVQKCEANIPKSDATQAEKDAANKAARKAAKQERNLFNHASKDAMVGQVQALMDKPNNRAYAIQLMKGFAKKYEDKGKIGPHAFDRFKEFFAKLNNEERKAFLKDTKIPFNNAQNDDLAKLPRRLPNLPTPMAQQPTPPGPPQRFADAQKPPPKRKSDNDAAVDAVLDTGAKPPLTPMQNRSSSSAITQVSQQNLSELLAALDSVEEKKLPKMGIRDYQKVETTDGKLSHVNINMFCTSDKTENGKVTEVKAETKPGSDGVTYSVKGGLVGKEREQTIEQICALAVETAKPGTVLSIPTSDPLKKATIEAALDKAFTEKYGDKYQKGNYTVPDAPKASAGLNK